MNDGELATKYSISNLRLACRVYPKDTDGFRVSQHRLEEWMTKRDAAMLQIARDIRKELTEQKQLIEVLQNERQHPND